MTRLLKKAWWTANPDFSYWQTPLIELAGRTLGVVGFGRIGRRVGALAHAFGMHALAFDALRVPAPDFAPFAWAGLPDVFQRRRRGLFTLPADE